MHNEQRQSEWSYITRVHYASFFDY